MWVWLGLFIVVLLLLYIFWRTPASSIRNTTDKPQVLEKAPEVGNTSASQTVLLQSNTGTLQAFIYPTSYKRTGQLTMCSSSTPAAPGEPDCSTGRFSMCVCDGGNCDKCKHVGYVNVLNISNVVRLEMLTVPDASRQNMAGVQLVLRTMRNPLPPNPKQGACPNGYYQFTEGNGRFCCPTEVREGSRNKCATPALDTKQLCALDANFTNGNPLCPAQLPEAGMIIQEETMVLPDIPFQKWTMITIAREGRRFDVYYNGSLVLSKRTQYMIASIAAYGPIIAGDPNLVGKITGVEVFPEKKTSSDVQRNYTRLADTNGKPYQQEPVDLSKMIPSCKDGSCFGGPTIRPASPLMDWETEYA